MAAKDFEKYFSWMRQKDFAPDSMNLYKAILKSFYKWQNKGTYPECVTWIKVGKTKSLKLPEDLLTQEEVKEMLKACSTPRDKAFVSVLWESGARIGEIGSLQLKNVSFDEFGCQIMVDGKTGMRRIRLVNAAPALLEWINQHPFNHNPNSWLWVNLYRDRGLLMGYGHLKKILGSIAKKAGIQKKVNPHNFRHSRATFLSQHLTEAQMKEYFGWVQDSGMAARYIHLSGKQVDDAILQLNGLKKEQQKETILMRTACPRCKNANDINSKYCEKCWLPLTPQAQNEVEEIRQKDQEGMLAVMKLLEMAKTNPGIIQEAVARAQTVRG
jgi:integrase